MLNEGLEKADLMRLVHPELHIDEFKSKLGNDEDVVVLSFKVRGKEPALDLVNFIEKGYPWVIDADVSSGEMEDGDYIVFVEAERQSGIAQEIMAMMADIMNLTAQELADWTVRYRGGDRDHPLESSSLTKLIPASPEEYLKKFGTADSDDEAESDPELDKLKAVSGVKVNTKAPNNEFTESLRRAAGIN